MGKRFLYLVGGSSKDFCFFFSLSSPLSLSCFPSICYTRFHVPRVFLVYLYHLTVRRDIGYAQSANTLTSVTGANRYRSRTHCHEKIRFVSVIRALDLVEQRFNFCHDGRTVGSMTQTRRPARSQMARIFTLDEIGVPNCA